MEKISRPGESKRPKKVDGAKTKIHRNGNRLGVKYKRRPTSQRLDDNKNGGSISFSTPSDIKKLGSCTITDDHIFKRSKLFFKRVIEKSNCGAGNERVDTSPRRSSSFVNNRKSNKNAPTAKANKRRSVQDVSIEDYERDTKGKRGREREKKVKGKNSGGVLKIHKSSSRVTKIQKGILRIPKELCLSGEAIKYTHDSIAVCCENSESERSLNSEKNLLGIFHTLLNLASHTTHLSDLACLGDSILKGVKVFYKNPKIAWFGCSILESVPIDNFKNKKGLEDFFKEIETSVVSIMSEHKEIASIQCAGIKLIWAISETKDSSPRTFSKLTIRNIVSAMSSFPEKGDVQLCSCLLLQRLSVDNRNEEVIGKVGGIPLVLTAALSLTLDKDIVKKACAALWNLSFSDKNREKMLGKEADKLIAKVIKNHTESRRPDIVSKACGVIWNLADFADAKEELIRHEIPELIVETMKNFRFDEKVQEMGCGCLRALAFNNESRIGLMEIGASKKILQSMKDHLKNQGIQYQAFAVLKKLSCNDTNEGRLIKMHAGERILEAMDAHLEEASIQERACGVLWNLAVNDDHKVKLVTIGCAEKMLEAMQAHENLEPVQFQTCRTLKRLARDSNNEVHLMRLGAADHVLKAMRLHLKSERIQEKGCGVLWNLSERDDHKRELMQLKAAEQILLSMNTHLTVANVQYEACGALKRLAVDDEIEKKLMKMQAASNVLKAMKEHVTVADVQGQACGVLWNLAFNGQKQLMELNAAEQILVAMENHKTNESVQEKACGTLWKLAEVGDNNENLIKLGVIKKVLDAMDNIPSHAGVQYQACGTLWNLAVQESNRKPLLIHRAEDRVLNVMKHHRDNENILHSACGVLFNLAQTPINLSKICSKADQSKVEAYMLLQNMNTKNGILGHAKDRVATVSNRLLLASKGAVTRLVQSVLAHPNNFEVFFQAITALNHISHDPRTIIFFLEEPSVLKEIVTAATLHIEEQGVPDHVIVLYTKLMQGIHTLSKQTAFSQQLVDSTKIIEAFVREASLRVLAIARVNVLNTFFQSKTVAFFFAAYSFVAQKQISLETQLNDRLLKPNITVKEPTRQDSGSSSFYSRSSSFLGNTRTSFFEENLKRKKFSGAQAQQKKEEEVFSKKTLALIIEKLAMIIGNNNAEDKTVELCFKLIEKMLKDSAKFPRNQLFSDTQELVLKNGLLLAKTVQIFSTDDKSKLHQKALWVLRFMVQFGNIKTIGSLAESKFLALLTNRLQYSPSQGKTFQYRTLVTVTMHMFISKLNTSLEEQISPAAFCAAITEVLASTCSTAYAGVADTLNLIKAICSLLSAPNLILKPVFVELVQSGRLPVLIDVLKVAESDIKRFHLCLNLLDVLQNMTEHVEVNEALVASEDFDDLLDRITKLNRLVLRHSYAYYRAKKAKSNILRGTKTLRRKKIKKRSSRKVGVKSHLRTIGRAGKENLEVVDPRVVLHVCEKICIIYRRMSYKNQKLAGILLENDEVFGQLKFVGALFSNGQNTKALSELAQASLKDIAGFAPKDIKRSRVGEEDAITVSI